MGLLSRGQQGRADRTKRAVPAPVMLESVCVIGYAGGQELWVVLDSSSLSFPEQCCSEAFFCQVEAGCGAAPELRPAGRGEKQLCSSERLPPSGHELPSSLSFPAPPFCHTRVCATSSPLPTTSGPSPLSQGHPTPVWRAEPGGRPRLCATLLSSWVSQGLTQRVRACRGPHSQ